MFPTGTTKMLNILTVVSVLEVGVEPIWQRCLTLARAPNPSPHLPLPLRLCLASFVGTDLADSDSGTPGSNTKIPSRQRVLNSLSAAGQIRARWPNPRSRNEVYLGFSLVEPVRYSSFGTYGKFLFV
jgi:hypothetical protein